MGNLLSCDHRGAIPCSHVFTWHTTKFQWTLALLIRKFPLVCYHTSLDRAKAWLIAKNVPVRKKLGKELWSSILLYILVQYCALQVSCLGGVGKWHLSMSLYKLTASVSCSLTKLSTWEPLPSYPFPWTTDLQSTVSHHCYSVYSLLPVKGSKCLVCLVVKVVSGYGPGEVSDSCIIPGHNHSMVLCWITQLSDLYTTPWASTCTVLEPLWDQTAAI